MLQLDYVEILYPVEGEQVNYDRLTPVKTIHNIPVQWANIERSAAAHRAELSVVRKMEGIEMKVGFTSKILGPRYSELITKDNIDFCLETVRSMGIVD
ncbi:hypothetical protein LX87_05706, partial [Larkinella arboricola]